MLRSKREFPKFTNSFTKEDMRATMTQGRDKLQAVAQKGSQKIAFVADELFERNLSQHELKEKYENTKTNFFIALTLGGTVLASLWAVWAALLVAAPTASAVSSAVSFLGDTASFFGSVVNAIYPAVLSGSVLGVMGMGVYLGKLKFNLSRAAIENAPEVQPAAVELKTQDEPVNEVTSPASVPSPILNAAKAPSPTENDWQAVTPTMPTGESEEDLQETAGSTPVVPANEAPSLKM
jgi:hypothetical protein